jgi:hypothetical protein
MKVMILFLLTLPLGAQTLPDAPKPRTDRLEWSLLAADAGIRSFDVYSTHRMLQNGGHELLLPRAISNHVPAMAAYSAGAVALNWWVARRLERHGHRQLARIATMIDIGQDAPWAIHNLFVRGKPKSILDTCGNNSYCVEKGMKP